MRIVRLRSPATKPPMAIACHGEPATNCRSMRMRAPSRTVSRMVASSEGLKASSPNAYKAAKHSSLVATSAVLSRPSATGGIPGGFASVSAAIIRARAIQIGAGSIRCMAVSACASQCPRKAPFGAIVAGLFATIQRRPMRAWCRYVELPVCAVPSVSASTACDG
jgi:hypothetical protein